MATTAFYLGVHNLAFMRRTSVPVFVSRRVIKRQRSKSWPRARGSWALDSGAFTELDKHGRYTFTVSDYAADVEEMCERIGQPDFVAPMDWMCEPFMLSRTGLTVADHIARTVDNFVQLRERLGPVVIPVLQGFGPREYERCAERYALMGVDIAGEERVGLGSVCRRANTVEGVRLVRYLATLLDVRFHGFGVKAAIYRACQRHLVSADSMAWSFAARKAGRDSNSLDEALAWRARLLASTTDHPEPPRDSGEAVAVNGLAALGPQHDIGAKREARE